MNISAHYPVLIKRVWEVCKFFLNGFCGFGDQCDKLHTEPEKKEVCKFYLKGFCGFGDECKQAHPEVCTFFQKGYCGFGDECTKAHIESSSNNSMLSPVACHLSPVNSPKKKT